MATEPKPKKERALDIFGLLGDIDKKKYELWDNFTDEQKKEFSPLVTMRWMAGTTSAMQIVFLNEIVNVALFNLPDHPEFLLKLLTVCSDGSPKRYSWINYKMTSSGKKKKSIELIAEHYNLSFKEAEDSVRLFSNDEIMELGEMYGLQKDELKSLKKELGA